MNIKPQQLKLSVLICTLPERIGKLSILLQKLAMQSQGKPVEILYAGDNRKRVVGSKRNDLLLMSQGEYVCFIDDDDMISDDYIDSILKGIESGNDCITFQVACFADGNYMKDCLYSKDFQMDNEDDKYYYRLPNHLMVIKSNLALSTTFKDINFGEDAAWAYDLRVKLRTEHAINKVLYTYYFSNTQSATANK